MSLKCYVVSEYIPWQIPKLEAKPSVKVFCFVFKLSYVDSLILRCSYVFTYTFWARRYMKVRVHSIIMSACRVQGLGNTKLDNVVVWSLPSVVVENISLIWSNHLEEPFAHRLSFCDFCRALGKLTTFSVPYNFEVHIRAF